MLKFPYTEENGWEIHSRRGGIAKLDEQTIRRTL